MLLNLCDICGLTVGHHPRCPYYIDKKTYYYCSICGDKINISDEYIEKESGEFRHYNCFNGIRELLHWLGYEIKVMDDNFE